jgi:hypothetical protein
MQIAKKCPNCQVPQSPETPLYLVSAEVKTVRFACAPCIGNMSGAKLGPKVPSEHFRVHGGNPSGAW